MSGEKNWSRNEITDLITVYEEKSVLCNTKDVEYRNREKKILEEIAANFRCFAEEL
ncbi:hypothetical protein WH47_10365 [Habropoda laboriosa]|uniref:MADF domain-containing protein n=1 Tax=Habropoda laboriosa TaxID=597456 RepID=A0A0L7R9P1_9HYME|nr:hypothetical protein WH47_10365 [Habropoda laboriosa]